MFSIFSVFLFVQNKKQERFFRHSCFFILFAQVIYLKPDLNIRVN